MTLRESTERPETVTIGTNELVGNCPNKIKAAFDRIRAGRWKSSEIPPLWDGKAGERIVAKLETLASADG
jgi:UDP-N-acetylglucosamine 2-epimerase (non-hydrolysing)